MGKMYDKLLGCLNVLDVRDIADYRKIRVINVWRFTDKAVHLEILSVSGEMWMPLSIMRVSGKGEIWVKEWKYKEMFEEN